MKSSRFVAFPLLFVVAVFSYSTVIKAESEVPLEVVEQIAGETSTLKSILMSPLNVLGKIIHGGRQGVECGGHCLVTSGEHVIKLAKENPKTAGVIGLVIAAVVLTKTKIGCKVRDSVLDLFNFVKDELFGNEDAKEQENAHKKLAYEMSKSEWNKA